MKTAVKSIRFKFFVFIAVLVAVLLLLLNFFPIRSSRDAIFEEKRTAMTNRGTAIASALSRLESLSTASIGEVLRLLDTQGISRVVVTDNDGTVLYDTSGHAGGKTDIGDIDIALKGKTVFRSVFSGGAFESGYATPMGTQNEITGAVYLKELDTEQAQLILSMQTRIRSIAAGVSLAAIVLAVIFSRTTLSRFLQISKSMKRVADGDYSYRLDVKGQDEISDLGNEFNELTARLEDTEKQRRRFVSDASHELKTPLASIRLLSDSIVQSDSMDIDTMREFVGDIGNEAERLQHTAEKLLDLSRLDDSVKVAEEPVDLKQVTIDALVLLKPLADEKKVNIKCRLEDGCVVLATVDDMFHMVFNLMENAIKYNTEGGRVLAGLKSVDDKVIFTVRDSGIGIPEEDRLNVFTRFYRVDKARSRAAGGSGLGLSIVHDAVKAHGGVITVGANKPKGSIFTVTFPKPTDEETGI